MDYNFLVLVSKDRMVKVFWQGDQQKVVLVWWIRWIKI